MDNPNFEPEDEKKEDKADAQPPATVRSLPPNYDEVLKTTALPPYHEGGLGAVGVWHTAAWVDETGFKPPPPSYTEHPGSEKIIVTGIVTPEGFQYSSRRRFRKICGCVVILLIVFLAMAAIGVGIGVSKMLAQAGQNGQMNSGLTPTVTPAPLAYLPSNESCGIRAGSIPSAYVVNGQQAQPGAWPWFVSIIYTDPVQRQTVMCGGSLLNNQWVLTSASCASYYRNPQYLTVYAGSVYFYNLADPNREALSADRVILNPNYSNMIQAGIVTNDVALIHLSTPTGYTTNVFPICQPTVNVNPLSFKVCVAMGFGAPTLLSGLLGIPSQYLLQGSMQPMSSSNCQQLVQQLTGAPWNVTAADFNDFFCAGNNPANGGSEVCKGDGGGPLVCQNQQNVWSVVGVSSFSIASCQLGVFAKVSTYNQWIGGVIAQYSV